jgi:hypothetical protein
MTEETTAEALNGVAEFAELSGYMDDPEFTKALEMIVKVMANPDIPPHKARSLIVWCDALAAKFAMLASFHAHVDKSDRAKKNMYFTGKESMQRMSDALKYIFK